MFREQELLQWIKNDHFNQFDKISKRSCTVQMMSVQSLCLKEMADDIAYKNSIIVIPVNLPFMKIAKNLVCSLSRLGIKNVMYWALDLDVYEMLLEEGKLAILMPGLNPMADIQKSKSSTLQKVLRSKPKLIEMFINAGLSVWVMDADMVALKDFRDIQDPSTNAFISYDSTDHLIGGVPLPSSSLMYFRHSNHSLKFLEKIKTELGVSSKLDDEEAMRRVITKQEGVEVLTSDHTRMYEGEEKLSEGIETTTGPVIIRYLDGLRFMSSKIFVDNPSFIPKGFEDFYTFHLHGTNVEAVLKKHSLWFLDQEETCNMDSPDPTPKFKMA
jgi:Nucleotide-diphospho-sugar transferase